MRVAFRKWLRNVELRDALLTSTFDAEERRLVARSVVIGVIVWALVFTLRAAVEFAFHATMQVVERAPSVLVVFRAGRSAIRCVGSALAARFPSRPGSLYERHPGLDEIDEMRSDIMLVCAFAGANVVAIRRHPTSSYF